MKSALRTLLCWGLFARRMPSAVAPTPGLRPRPGHGVPQTGARAAAQLADGGLRSRGHQPAVTSPAVSDPAMTSPVVTSPAGASSMVKSPVVASPWDRRPRPDGVARACPVMASLVQPAPWHDRPVTGPAPWWRTAPGSGQPGGPLRPARTPSAVRPHRPEAPPAGRPACTRQRPGAAPAGPLPGGRGGQAGRSGLPARPVRPGSARAVDMDLAAEFIQLHRREVPGAGPAGPRLREIRREISLTGTYRHTLEELEFGARVAWRNSSRCIGRLYWKSLKVRDRREVDQRGGHRRGVRRPSAGRHEPWPGQARHHRVRTGYAGPAAARASGTSSSSGTPATAQPDGSVRGEPAQRGAHQPGPRARLGHRRPGPLRRPAADHLHRRRAPPGVRRAGRRGHRGPPDPPALSLVRRAGPALVRGAGHLRHVPGDRRHLLSGGPVQRLVHGHRDRRAQPGGFRPLQPAARNRGPDGAGHRPGPLAVARPGARGAQPRGAALVRDGRA